MELRPRGGRSSSVRARTDPDGRYALRHLPEGADRVLVVRSGYVHLERELPALVPGQDTGPFDLVLTPARSIRGVVVDPNGAPIEGARVTGRPPGSGQLPWPAETGIDGTFALYLQSGDRSTLAVSHPDHRAWGDVENVDSLVDAGAADVRIVMEPADRTRFVVIDRETGAPIERFGFRIFPPDPTGMKRIRNPWLERPPLAGRPGGTVEAAAEPG
ncbi:MAG: carboxypeptidase-like regulatory domain-containing protein, partial [Planctomycetota bacterium]